MTRWILAAALPLALASASIAHAGEWTEYKRISKPGAHIKSQHVNTSWQNGNAPHDPIAADQAARGYDATREQRDLPVIDNKPAAKQSFDLGNGTHFDFSAGKSPNN